MSGAAGVRSLSVRVLLIGSCLVFAAGAIPPALGGVWGGGFEAGLRWIAANPGAWAFSAFSFITSLTMCVAGLSLVSDVFQDGAARVFSKIAFQLFFIGALLWIISMGFRLSVTPWAAGILAQTSALPDAHVPLRQLESRLYEVFMVSTFLASAIYGAALLALPQRSRGLGWFAVLYGLGAAALFVISRGPIPIMVLVVPLALGLSALPSE